MTTGFCRSQNLFLCYEPIKQDLKNGEWNKIDAHLDSMYTEFSDSTIVPFTLNRIGDAFFKSQNFNQLYKYSKLMLAYDYEKLETRFPESSSSKWDWYCRYLPTTKIYAWGHFYLAASYLERKQYDSCLVHLNQTSIENYTSIPRRYSYNVSAGIQTTMMRSICLEGLGQMEEAREMLLPYLFLDNFSEVPNYYTHCDVINQYFKLLEKFRPNNLPFFSTDAVFTIKEKASKKKRGFQPTEYTASNDSIVKPSGWHTFEFSPAGRFIRVEDIYVPIYVDSWYYMALEENVEFSIEEYLKQTEFYEIYTKRNSNK
ncbi:MAG: hypothetical protein ACJA1C_000495 [Crocinitomicaceae bacterium]|jgi:hypothetical protein